MITVVVEFQATPGARAELKGLLQGISATHGPQTPGFLGSTVYEVLDNPDGLVEIAEWDSPQSQAAAVAQATASGVYAPVIDLVAAPFSDPDRSAAVGVSLLTVADIPAPAGTHCCQILGSGRRSLHAPGHQDLPPGTFDPGDADAGSRWAEWPSRRSACLGESDGHNGDAAGGQPSD